MHFKDGMEEKSTKINKQRIKMYKNSNYESFELKPCKVGLLSSGRLDVWASRFLS